MNQIRCFSVLCQYLRGSQVIHKVAILSIHGSFLLNTSLTLSIYFVTIQCTWIVAMSNRCWSTIPEVIMAGMPHPSLQGCIYPAPNPSIKDMIIWKYIFKTHEVYGVQLC